ncbi:MAG TPA: nucleotidyl transferase AbiEii/AbiGii toxin family protein [Microthrixaceae bacterium]|nr:nucleotidyl transferase AbiEii/AbiGii toxin family protein [Microthrixaceae bacterium]
MSADSVVLTGRPGGTTHRAVEVLSELPAELRLIGGIAVLCRVGVPHRATVDLDAVTRGLVDQHERLSHLALTAAGGGQYRFAGEMELDVIDVAPDDAATLLDTWAASGPLTDLELNVVAHTWAHDAASPLDISVVDDERGERLSIAPARMVASPAGLVVMKATTVGLRASSKPEKRASDLYDIGRLLVTARDLPNAFAAMPTTLADVVRDSLRGWFVDDAGRDRTYREVRRFDEPRLDLDGAADAVERL